jgi:hypothetical protein
MGAYACDAQCTRSSTDIDNCRNLRERMGAGDRRSVWLVRLAMARSQFSASSGCRYQVRTYPRLRRTEMLVQPFARCAGDRAMLGHARRGILSDIGSFSRRGHPDELADDKTCIFRGRAGH